MIRELRCKRFQLSLAEPFANAHSTWHHREGLSVYLGSGVSPESCLETGLGEASPLPGFSRESLEQCEQFLNTMAKRPLENILAATSVSSLVEALEVALVQAPPAARFAVETAAFDRLGKIQELPSWRLLRIASQLTASPHETETPLPLAGVVPGGNAQVALRCAEQLHRQGVRTFKVKVGPDTLTENQLSTLRALRARFGRTVRLRLDANRSFSAEHWQTVSSHLEYLTIELLEEPWPWAHPDWPLESPTDLAVDESLHGLNDEEAQEVLHASQTRQIVLKPTALGGLLYCLSLAGAARRQGKHAIISHTLEATVGWSSCAHLALALGGELAAGLWPVAHQIDGSATPIVNGCLLASERAGLGVADPNSAFEKFCL